MRPGPDGGAPLVSGDPALMEAFGEHGMDRADRLRVLANRLESSLTTVERSRSEFVIVLPPLVERLRTLAADFHEIDQDVGDVGTALRAADSGSFVDRAIGTARLAALLAALEHEARHTDRPWAVDPAKVQQATKAMGASLDDDFRGVSGSDLRDIERALDGLSGPEVDAAVARLSDAQLARWMGARTASGWFFDDKFSEHDHWLMLAMLGEKVSLTTWRRLGRFTEDIDPDPTTGLGDGAHPDPATKDYFDALYTREFDGTRWALGPSDHYRFSPDDVAQGAVGDCYLITSLQALAFHNGDDLQRHIRPNPNGTFTVTFANGDRVVVSADYAVHPDNPALPVYAHNGREHDGGSAIEQWPMLFEKAYAQHRGGYGAIAGGWPGPTLESLTGAKASRIEGHDLTAAGLQRTLDSGGIVTFGTLFKKGDESDADFRKRAPAPYTPGPSGEPRLHAAHAYWVVGVDLATGTVQVHNPWYADDSTITLTIDEFKESVSRVELNVP